MSKEECCNQECNQGRNCPNSKSETMNGVLMFIFVVFIVVGAVFGIVNMETKKAVYDCRISEISPDVPIEVKEQCRKLNAQK